MRKAHLGLVSLIAVILAAAPGLAQSTTKTSTKTKATTKADQPTLIARPPYVQKHKIGDRVQVYYQNWYPATIREVGKGDYRGFYRVAFDNFERQRWVDDDEIMAIPAGATHPLAFLTGSYQCYRGRGTAKKPQVVDNLFIESNGDYHLADDLRLGRIFLAKDNRIVWHGGALDEADAHLDGKGMLHIVTTKHEHWVDSDPQPMQCVQH